jgi:hypothetical protein
VNALAEGADPLALSAEGLAMDLCPPWAMDAWTALQRAGGLGLYDWLRGELALVDGECTVVLSAGMAAAILRDAAFRSMLGYLSTPADESDAAACMERVLGINRVIVKNGWETSSPLLSIFH